MERTEQSFVNMSVPPVICAIVTDHPLPSWAWSHVGRLAQAVEECARHLGAEDD
jgi:hypothetical protein